MTTRPLLRLALLLVVGLAVSGCSPLRPGPADAGPRATASVQELMQSLVDPSADALWEAVSSEVTAAGVVEQGPASDADWLQLRHQALRLAEAASLLRVPGRPVAQPGQTLEDAQVAGILTAGEIEARIRAEPDAWAARSLALQAAAERILAAVDRRDLQDYLGSGTLLDHACEGCHRQFWYPNDRIPAR